MLEWTPEHRLVISIDSTKKLPIASGTVTFSFDEGDSMTPSTVNYRYETKWGPLGRLMGPLLDRQLTKGFGGFLEDLERAAQEG